VAGQTGERGVKRTEILEPLVTEDGQLVFDRRRAIEHLEDMLSTLIAVGGSVRIVSDRVLVGKLPADAAGFREPIGQTVGLVVEYSTQAPLHHESLTLYMLGSLDDGAPAGPSLADEMAAGGDEPDEELEQDETGQGEEG
jgi:hypothetical protein